MSVYLIRLLSGVLFIGMVCMLLTACGGGGGGDSSATVRTGTVTVALTDDFEGYEEVVLTIREIGIVANNTATTYYNATDIDTLPIAVNIVDFPEEATLDLAEIEVTLPENGQPVCFNQVRLVLAREGDPDCSSTYCNYVVETGQVDPYPLKTPSGQQSGVKVLTPNEFCLEPGNDAVKVTIDFDPSTAIVRDDNANNDKDKFVLKPTGIRIVQADWLTDPAAFINGLTLVPAETSVSGCVAYATAPLVTVDAREVDADESPPVVTTVALAEGPVVKADVCTEWCDDDIDPAACEADCAVGLGEECYYRGKFKLLLPEQEDYDVKASWGTFAAVEPAVPFNSTVLLELLQE